MKIVMLTDIYDERMQYQDNLFAKYYAKHGHEVTILASTIGNTLDYYAGRERYDPRAPAREYWDGKAKVVKLPYSLNFLNRLRKLAGVDEVLERERPDVIFSHDIHLNLDEAVAYRRRHPECRIILDYHADRSNSGRNWLSRLVLHRLTRKRLLHRCMDEIDKIYPVVPAGADFLHELYDVPRERMELLPLGADTDLAHETRSSGVGRRIRETLGIGPDDFVVFTGGKLTPEKKTDLLVEAVARIEEPPVHLVVVGRPPDSSTEYAKALESAHRACPRLHFVGWVHSDAVYGYMDACDIAVFPASQSVLWQQALSMSLPLVVGRLGVQDPSYLNVHGALTILPEHAIAPSTLRGAILELIGDPEKLAAKREAALATADGLLNYHRLVSQTLGEAS